MTYTVPTGKSTPVSVYPNRAKDVLGITGPDATTNSYLSTADASGYIWLTATAKRPPIVNNEHLRIGRMALKTPQACGMTAPIILIKL